MVEAKSNLPCGYAGEGLLHKTESFEQMKLRPRFLLLPLFIAGMLPVTQDVQADWRRDGAYGNGYGRYYGDGYGRQRGDARGTGRGFGDWRIHMDARLDADVDVHDWMDMDTWLDADEWFDWRDGHGQKHRWYRWRDPRYRYYAPYQYPQAPRYRGR